MLFQLFVDVEHLADGCVKAGKQLAAHDENINVTYAELVLHRLFIGICITVAVHHFIPVGNDLIVSPLIYIVCTFPEIGRRDHHGTGQIAELLKALQIADCIPLVVCGQHGLEASILIPFDEMFVDVQSDPLDPGVGGGESADTAPFPGQVIPLSFREPFGGLFEPEVDICFVHILFHKAAFVNKRHNGSVIHTVLDGIFMDQLSELRHSVLLFFHQRRSGKADVAGIWERCPHFGGQQAVVGAVALIHQQEHIP